MILAYDINQLNHLKCENLGNFVYVFHGGRSFFFLFGLTNSVTNEFLSLTYLLIDSKESKST
jgi:hypothetical protein